jgi:hypothetical protein
MTIIKTSELTGAALDWAVAKCEGRNVETENGLVNWPYLTGYSPSTYWLHGGSIIERKKLAISPLIDHTWAAYAAESTRIASAGQNKIEVFSWGFRNIGPTPLIAAMRCYVASKMGETVEVPEELTQ